MEPRPPALPPVAATPVLSYRSTVAPGVPRTVTYERTDGILTITIPPPSLVGRIVVLSSAMGACALPAAIIASWLVANAINRRSWARDSDFFILVVFLVVLVLAATWSLQRLVYCSRHGRVPSIVRVWRGGLEMSTAGTVRPVFYRFTREQIADLYVHSVGGRRPRLNLQVITTDDAMLNLILPWPAGRPMIEVEDNLRDVLGLPPVAPR